MTGTRTARVGDGHGDQDEDEDGRDEGGYEGERGLE